MNTVSSPLDYLPIVLMFIVALGFVITTMLASHWLGPKHKTKIKVSLKKRAKKCYRFSLEKTRILRQTQLIFTAYTLNLKQKRYCETQNTAKLVSAYKYSFFYDSFLVIFDTFKILL